MSHRFSQCLTTKLRFKVRWMFADSVYSFHEDWKTTQHTQPGSCWSICWLTQRNWMGWVGLRFCEFKRCAKLKWNLEFCACISPSLYHSSEDGTVAAAVSSWAMTSRLRIYHQICISFKSLNLHHTIWHDMTRHIWISSEWCFWAPSASAKLRSRLSLPSDRQRMPCCRTKQCHRQRRRTPLLPPAELNGIAELSERKGENGEDSKLRHRSMGVGAGTDCCMVFASFRFF